MRFRLSIKILAVFTAAIILISASTGVIKAQTDVITDPKEKLKKDLLLSLPPVTENPNFTITFTDPSGKGVFLTIDGKEEIQIENPYSLPSLGIGRHSLGFRFTDASGSEQNVEDYLVITPRPTEISAPQIVDGKVKISGSAVAQSEVRIFASGGKMNERGEAIASDDGKWEYTFETDFDPGIYTVVAIVKKNGLASNFSEPKTFQVDDGNSEKPIVIDELSDGSFSLANLKLSELQPRRLASEIVENPQSAIFLGLFVLVGLICGVLLFALISKRGDKSAEKMLREAFGTNKSDDAKPSADVKNPDTGKPSIKNKLKKITQKESEQEPEKDHIDIDIDKDEREKSDDAKAKTNSDAKPEPKPNSDESSAKAENKDIITSEPVIQEQSVEKKGNSKESLSEKLKKAEVEFTKDQFLKEYQAFDPDPDKQKGEKNKNPKKGKKTSRKDDLKKGSDKQPDIDQSKERNIKITLTSEVIKKPQEEEEE